jgi:hypothetical protein
MAKLPRRLAVVTVGATTAVTVYAVAANLLAVVATSH